MPNKILNTKHLKKLKSVDIFRSRIGKNVLIGGRGGLCSYMRDTLPVARAGRLGTCENLHNTPQHDSTERRACDIAHYLDNRVSVNTCTVLSAPVISRCLSICDLRILNVRFLGHHNRFDGNAAYLWGYDETFFIYL